MPKKKLINRIKNEDGSALVLVALTMTVLIGFAALVTDVGLAYAEKSKLQNTADAVALAAAQELPQDRNEALSVANSYATANGVPTDALTIDIPSDNRSISVTINTEVPTFFAKIFGVTSSDVAAASTARIGVAASVPWIVPFVIPKPPAFNYDHDYVMRMYGAGDYVTYEDTGYPPTMKKKVNNKYKEVPWDYPSDYKSDPIYKNYPLSNRYPYQFDYMNVNIKENSTTNDYYKWLANGYKDTFSVNQPMYYRSPSSGGTKAIDALQSRLGNNPETDYTKAKIGDPQVILIPIVESMLSRNNTPPKTQMTIIGFAGFFIKDVHRLDGDGDRYWFEGRFLEDLNIGSGEVSYDPEADFGLRVIKLTK